MPACGSRFIFIRIKSILSKTRARAHHPPRRLSCLICWEKNFCSISSSSTMLYKVRCKISLSNAAAAAAQAKAKQAFNYLTQVKVASNYLYYIYKRGWGGFWSTHTKLFWFNCVNNCCTPVKLLVHPPWCPPHANYKVERNSDSDFIYAAV